MLCLSWAAKVRFSEPSVGFVYLRQYSFPQVLPMVTRIISTSLAYDVDGNPPIETKRDELVPYGKDFNLQALGRWTNMLIKGVLLARECNISYKYSLSIVAKTSRI